MTTLMEILAGQLGQQATATIAARLGIDERTARQAVSIALPMIMAALARNASSERGATSLNRALEKDHDGSLLDALNDFASRGETDEGQSILEHVFGSRRPRVESAVGRSTGLDSATVSKLFALLAPMVMAQLGRSRQAQSLDSDGLADLLQQERARIDAAAAPSADSERSRPTTSPLGELARQLLDADGDGDLTDDAIRAGGGFLSELLGGR